MTKLINSEMTILAKAKSLVRLLIRRSTTALIAKFYDISPGYILQEQYLHLIDSMSAIVRSLIQRKVKEALPEPRPRQNPTYHKLRFHSAPNSDTFNTPKNLKYDIILQEQAVQYEPLWMSRHVIKSSISKSSSYLSVKSFNKNSSLTPNSYLDKERNIADKYLTPTIVLNWPENEKQKFYKRYSCKTTVTFLNQSDSDSSVSERNSQSAESQVDTPKSMQSKIKTIKRMNLFAIECPPHLKDQKFTSSPFRSYYESSKLQEISPEQQELLNTYNEVNAQKSPLDPHRASLLPCAKYRTISIPSIPQKVKFPSLSNFYTFGTTSSDPAIDSVNLLPPSPDQSPKHSSELKPYSVLPRLKTACLNAASDNQTSARKRSSMHSISGRNFMQSYENTLNTDSMTAISKVIFNPLKYSDIRYNHSSSNRSSQSLCNTSYFNGSERFHSYIYDRYSGSRKVSRCSLDDLDIPLCTPLPRYFFTVNSPVRTVEPISLDAAASLLKPRGNKREIQLDSRTTRLPLKPSKALLEALDNKDKMVFAACRSLQSSILRRKIISKLKEPKSASSKSSTTMRTSAAEDCFVDFINEESKNAKGGSPEKADIEQKPSRNSIVNSKASSEGFMDTHDQSKENSSGSS